MMIPTVLTRLDDSCYASASITGNLNKLRIVLLGKTGDGRSSTGNTILGKELFCTGDSPNPVTRRCESRSNTIDGRNIKVLDTPGFFDASLPQKLLNDEILRCITECAPGPHAFLIVLRVGRYTEQEKEVVTKITALFGEDALNHAVVLFTHGGQLSEKQTIQDFVEKSAELQELVDKCGGRAHVIDNEDWKQRQDEYRSNRVQVQKLLNTIEKMVKKNGGRRYTNEMLQAVNRSIKEELKKNRNEGSEKEKIKQAKQEVQTKLSVRIAGVLTGILVGAFLGAIVGVFCVVAVIGQISGSPVLAQALGLQAVSAGEIALVAGGFVGVFAVIGGVAGAVIGLQAVKGVENVGEAIQEAANAVVDIAIDGVNKIKSFLK